MRKLFATIGTIGLSVLPHLAHAQEAAVVTPGGAAILFSGPHFFAALLVGIALAVAFQLALTHLSVAAGVSAVGPVDKRETDTSRDENIEARRIKGRWRPFARSRRGTASGHWSRRASPSFLPAGWRSRSA
ncbi:MAG: hypothetical protein MPW15_26110 [Candidatus Manganitrophus sp.]|nr:hypothetical protein [Candidatus Manganitrophus sp.]